MTEMGLARLRISVRRLAKRSGSLQGEILTRRAWVQTANACNIEVEAFAFQNYPEFHNSIIKCLSQGKIVKLCISSSISGRARPYRYDCAYNTADSMAKLEIAEHSVLISDYCPARNSFKVSMELGSEIFVNSYKLYLSNLSLVTKRSPEHYIKLNLAIAKQGSNLVRFNATNFMDDVKYSHLSDNGLYFCTHNKLPVLTTPTPNSLGFRGVLFGCSAINK